ncbi:MAG: thiamine phosphate synthase [Muribaculaceae bacterium]|nr:thiamine phosphate synthase [Muribaculaceae bacterium]
MFRLIAITRPGTVDLCREAASIMRAIDTHRFDRVHIRKSAPEGAMSLLSLIPERYRAMLSVHNATAEVVDRYPGVGVHLTGMTPDAPAGFNGVLSRSCHSIAELQLLGNDIDYVFLSPVFDSISKTGYRSNFSFADLAEASRQGVINERVIALGGVTSSRLAELQSLGFGGAAMLGAAWPEPIGDEFNLQFISHTNDSWPDPLDGIRLALAGGCRWCQLRMKNSTTAHRIATGREAVRLCSDAGATFIIDDDVDAVLAAGAHGVHLGKNDMPVSEARRILPDKIIGATANTAGDIIAAWNAGADYVGLGPFRFTTTKQGLSPVLGLDGYRSVVAEARCAGVDIPIVAIGGITQADIPSILSAGPDGVAISGAILNAADPVTATRDIISAIRNH